AVEHRVVGAIQLFSLIGRNERDELWRRVIKRRIHCRDATVAVLTQYESSVLVEEQSIRSGLSASRGLGTCVAGWMKILFHPARFGPFENLIRRYVGIQQHVVRGNP